MHGKEGRECMGEYKAETKNAFCSPNLLLWLTSGIVTKWQVSEEFISHLTHPQSNGKIPPCFCKISTHCVPHTLDSIRRNGKRLFPKLFSTAWVHPSFREIRIYELFDSSWSVDPSLQQYPWLFSYGWLSGNLVKYRLSPWLKRESLAFPFHDTYYKAAHHYSLTVLNWTQVPEWSTHQRHFHSVIATIRFRKNTEAKVPDGQEFESPILPLLAAWLLASHLALLKLSFIRWKMKQKWYVPSGIIQFNVARTVKCLWRVYRTWERRGSSELELPKGSSTSEPLPLCVSLWAQSGVFSAKKRSPGASRLTSSAATNYWEHLVICLPRLGPCSHTYKARSVDLICHLSVFTLWF